MKNRFSITLGGGDTTDLTDSLAMANNRAAPSGAHFAQPPKTSRSLLHYIGKGELGGSYPNIPAAKMDKEPVVHKVAPKPSSKWAIEDMVVDDTPNFMGKYLFSILFPLNQSCIAVQN